MLTDTNRIRDRWLEGATAFGVAIHLRDPAIVELVGLAGFDAAFIDMENSTLELGAVEELIRAAEVAGIAPIVRVPGLDPVTIRRVLDLGAQGVTVPHVQSSEEAKAAVMATRYQPQGERGVSPVSRAARYGAVEWNEYSRAANANVVLSVMVEDHRGLENLESIASTPGLDVVAVGPSDLSESLGITQPNDPRLRSVIAEIASKLKKIGNAKMALPMNHRMISMTPADLQQLGVAYSNVGPAIERVLLVHLQEQARILKG